MKIVFYLIVSLFLLSGCRENKTPPLTEIEAIINEPFTVISNTKVIFSEPSDLAIHFGVFSDVIHRGIIGPNTMVKITLTERGKNFVVDNSEKFWAIGGVPDTLDITSENSGEFLLIMKSYEGEVIERDDIGDTRSRVTSAEFELGIVTE